MIIARDKFGKNFEGKMTLTPQVTTA